MKTRILLSIALGLSLLVANAQNYSIYSATKGVEVQSGGKTVAATEGMSLKANDMLIVPQGGSVSVLDRTSNDIFTSVSTGKFTVAGLKIEAQKSAKDKTGTIMTGYYKRFGEGGGRNVVYEEKGMVNRSLSVYDPEGDNLEMVPATLARYIVSKINSGKSDSMDVALNSGEAGTGGLFFRLENTLDFPVYFNVLTVGDREVEISPLGQPNGTYVVLPHQALQREHLLPLSKEDRQMIVVTPCQYDLDAIIEEINTRLRGNERPDREETSACVMFLN